MTLEAAQYIEGARNHLNNVAIAGKIAGQHSLFTEPLRASSHVVPPPLIPFHGIKFHLQNKLPQAICGHKPRAPALYLRILQLRSRGGCPGERNA
jgi:hypothetical protein